MGVAVWPNPAMVTTMPVGTGMLLDSVIVKMLTSQGVAEDSCQPKSERLNVGWTMCKGLKGPGLATMSVLLVATRFDASAPSI